MASKSHLLLAIGCTIGICLFGFRSFAEDFTCQTLDGEKITITQWPVFIITSRSEKDLSESLRCASLVGSLETQAWLIDFAWPQSEIAKRLAAKRLLRSDYMKKRSTILNGLISDLPLLSLIDSQFQIIWSSATIPTDDDWSWALEILKRSKEP